jgi:hypothetical protein
MRIRFAAIDFVGMTGGVPRRTASRGTRRNRKPCPNSFFGGKGFSKGTAAWPSKHWPPLRRKRKGRPLRSITAGTLVGQLPRLAQGPVLAPFLPRAERWTLMAVLSIASRIDSVS